jgi:hypothetical protein
MASTEAKVKVEVDSDRKCIIAGCEIPRRHEIKHPDIGVRFMVCGEHRKELAEMLNREAVPIAESRRLAVQRVIEYVHDMGDHSAEKSLALAT